MKKKNKSFPVKSALLLGAAVGLGLVAAQEDVPPDGGDAAHVGDGAEIVAHGLLRPQRTAASAAS